MKRADESLVKYGNLRILMVISKLHTMKCKFSFILFFSFLTSFFHFALASGKQDYYFRRLNTENGLSQNTVRSILQDKTGFMWFGTNDGLNRYDGNTFRVFKYDEKNPSSIGNNTIWSLLQTPDGKIWAGTEKGIFIYDPEDDSFDFFDLKTENNECIKDVVLDMQIDPSGNVWIASKNLFRYSTRTGKLETMIFLDREHTSLLSRIWSVNIDKDEQVWISIYHGGIRRYNPIENNFKSYTRDAWGKNFSSSLTSKTVNINNDYLLIGSFNEELRMLDKTTGKVVPYPIERGKDNKLFVRDMEVFSDGNCWIGTERGLYIYDIKNGSTVHLTHQVGDPYSLSDNAIYSMYEDREGGIWIGTYFGGVNYFPRPYTYFKKYYPVKNRNSISGERVSGICEDSDGNIWIGTEDAGLNKLDVRTDRFECFSPTSENPSYSNTINYHNVHDIIIDGNLLWVATYSHGINVLNLRTKEWKYYMRGDQEGMLNNNDIFALFKDSAGRIWIGTSTGAFLFDRRTEKFILQEQIGLHFISDIIEDSSGQIWFSTSDVGVYCFNPRTKECKLYPHDPADPRSICYHKIICMFVDSKKRIWFASESRGICRFDDKTQQFVRYGMKDGFTNDVIYKILEDNEGNLWLSSNSGLMQFNPETGMVRTFTQSNGLPGNQFNCKSGYKDKTGKMYFGCLNGLVAFHPAEFHSNDFVPSVALTDFRLLNQEKDFSQNRLKESSVRLAYDQSSFSIGFSALSYVAPEMNKYAYKMEGLDAGWNYISSAQKITYSNLPPGKYVFRVKASNNDGVWNETGDFLEIVVLPPFWKTSWAYGLYIVFSLLAVFFIFRYYRNRMESRNRSRRILYENEKEKEVYHSKIEFFTNVAHEIRTPLTLIKGPLEYIIKTDVDKEELQTNLNIMERNTDRLLALINQLLDFRKTESKVFSLTFTRENMTGLLEDTCDRFMPLVHQKGLEFRLSGMEAACYADVDKDAVTKVVSNLFANAIKYARRSILAELSFTADRFRICVRNDGELIPEELKNKIFEPFFSRTSGEEDRFKASSGIGLALVKSLVELHGGEVFLDVRDREMNTFVVSLPMRQKNVSEADSPEATGEKMPEESPQLFKGVSERESKNGYSVLVVEDDEELLLFIEKRLEKQYTVYKAKNGVEAVTVLQEKVVNLVISDIMMPQMNGYELCSRIKQDVEFSHIPVILLTAKTNVQSKIAGLECGADAYIEKPFSIEHLQAQIYNIFDNRKKMREAFVSSPFSHTDNITLTKSDEQFLNRLIEVINKNISNPGFNVDHLAEELCMSRSSLLRKIKGVTESTPNDFIRLIRLKRAAEILSEGEYKVNEVCYLVGFSSTSYFSKVFQKQFGVLPKDFVKKKDYPRGTVQDFV